MVSVSGVESEFIIGTVRLTDPLAMEIVPKSKDCAVSVEFCSFVVGASVRDGLLLQANPANTAATITTVMIGV